jgi:hypothetical protein
LVIEQIALETAGAFCSLTNCYTLRQNATCTFYT